MTAGYFRALHEDSSGALTLIKPAKGKQDDPLAPHRRHDGARFYRM
jgi:hypothetical protein